MSEQYRETELGNGLTILTEAMPGLRSASLGIWVRAGSVTVYVMPLPWCLTSSGSSKYHGGIYACHCWWKLPACHCWWDTRAMAGMRKFCRCPGVSPAAAPLYATALFIHAIAPFMVDGSRFTLVIVQV